MVEITDISALEPKAAKPGADVPEVARRALEESSPDRPSPTTRAPDGPQARGPSAGVLGSHRIHIMLAGGGRVRETVTEDLADVTRAIAEAGDHEVWIDIEARDTGPP